MLEINPLHEKMPRGAMLRELEISCLAVASVYFLLNYDYSNYFRMYCRSRSLFLCLNREMRACGNLSMLVLSMPMRVCEMIRADLLLNYDYSNYFRMYCRSRYLVSCLNRKMRACGDLSMLVLSMPMRVCEMIRADFLLYFTI